MRNDYMTQEVARVLRKFFGPPPEKLCRQTCPQCGWGRVLDWIGVPWKDLPDGNFEGQCSLWGV